MKIIFSTTSTVLHSIPSVQSIFYFLLSTLLVVGECLKERSDRQYFVYPHAPERLVAPARRLGKLEHLNYISAVRNVKGDEEKLLLYTHHFSQCSSIGSDSNPSSQPTAQESTVERRSLPTPSISSTPSTPIQRLVEALGVDPVSSKFFTLPQSELKSSIRSACLKNELQFQCAYGFLNDVDKIEEHIQLMKQNDGTFKVMAESECQLVDEPLEKPASSIYSCLHARADAILSECSKSLEVYNATRVEVNSKMHATFMETISTIEEHAEEAIAKGNSQALESVLRKGETLIETTLTELLKLEAFKCRHYSQMARCVLATVGEHCSPTSPSSQESAPADALSTILRVGYLQRERGDLLHHQFLEAEIQPHRACQMFS